MISGESRWGGQGGDERETNARGTDAGFVWNLVLSVNAFGTRQGGGSGDQGYEPLV
jgi:hypothetical protein